MHLDLYIARHEEAASAYDTPDRNRTLTPYGRHKARVTGQRLLEQPDVIDTLWTSPLVRAVQTAEIYAGALGLDEVVAQPIIASPPHVNGLVDALLTCPASTRGLLIVGHQPTLGLLISHLLGQEYLRGVSTGSLAALRVNRTQRNATFRWSVEGHPPAVVRDLHA